MGSGLRRAVVILTAGLLTASIAAARAPRRAPEPLPALHAGHVVVRNGRGACTLRDEAVCRAPDAPARCRTPRAISVECPEGLERGHSMTVHDDGGCDIEATTSTCRVGPGRWCCLPSRPTRVLCPGASAVVPDPRNPF